MYNDLNGSGGLSGNMLNTDAITIGQYTYEYVVGDGITCPFDTSEISILFIEMPNVTFETDTIELCYEVCQPISIAISGGVDFQFDLSVQDANGAAQGNTTLTSDIDIFSIYLCNDQTNIGFANDTLNFSNQDSLLLQIENVSSDVCASDIVDSLWITSLPQNIFELDTSICIFDTLTINGQEFFLGNSTYIDTLDGIACDSFININVSFDDADTTFILETICLGDSTNYFSTWYSEANPSGVLNVETDSGCDSVFVIDISFYEVADSLIDLTLCEGDFLEINGTVFDESNPVGEVIYRTDTLCEGESIVIGGTIIDENNNPTQLIVPGVDCDTTFNIDLTFTAPTTNSITGIFCSDFDTLVNGVIYDINNASNTDIITGGNYLGCDSIIIIDLQFNNGIEVTRTDTLCEGESIVIGGTIIDESNNPTQLIVPGVDCDTTINVDLTFAAVSTNPITGTFCSDFDTLINGNLYNMLNPADTEIITGGNYLGCDSIIIVDLSFTPCDIDVAVTAVGNNCVGESQGAFNVQINSPVDIPYIIVLEEISSGELTNINVSVEQTNYQFENLSSGAYNISVIDNTGATLYTTTEDINDLFPELTGDWSLIDTIFCNGDEAQLEFLATGGMLDYNYAWSESQVGDSPLASDLSAGIYQVTVTDMNGCTFDSSYEITEPLPFIGRLRFRLYNRSRRFCRYSRSATRG